MGDESLQYMNTKMQMEITESFHHIRPITFTYPIKRFESIKYAQVIAIKM